VEAAIERAFGTTLLLGRPTPSRLAAWRTRAQLVAAREAGYAYAAYGHLKIASVTEEIAAALSRRAELREKPQQERVRQTVWRAVRGAGLTADDCLTPAGTSQNVINYLRNFDLSYRLRRLRLMSRRLGEMEQLATVPIPATAAARTATFDLIGQYQAAAARGQRGASSLAEIESRTEEAMAAYAMELDLRNLDDRADGAISEVLSGLPKPERRILILTYLGFPFYDIATLPLLQGEGLDEFDPIKVDRISPDDATAIRTGGTAATLKGIQFNSFGAFFSRAYRENDYLWGRLHGADRLIDIIVSTLGEGLMPNEAVMALKHEAFRAILEEERPRLGQIGPLFDEIEREIGR
jgi:hypothetical protein